MQGAHEAPGRAELFDGWYPRNHAPIKGRTVLDTSGRRPLFEQPDDFLDYLTDVVVPNTAQTAPAVMTSPGDENGDHKHDHRHPTT